MNSSDTVAVAYIPVLHQGYIRFIEEAIGRGASKLYLVGDDILASHEEFDYLNRKDRLRAVMQTDMVSALAALVSIPVSVISKDAIGEFGGVGAVIMPQEDVTTFLWQEYFPDTEIIRVPIFLRWHRDNVLEEKAVEAHRSVSVSDFDRECIQGVFAESEKSSDWWRQIGAMIVKDGEPIIVAHNSHMPDPEITQSVGDARSIFKRGINIHISSAAHAEMIAIAEAARNGISLAGASIYVTDFPCPYCAKLIAHSGISKCFFGRGYAVLDGETVLKAAGVELVLVDTKKGEAAEASPKID